MATQTNNYNSSARLCFQFSTKRDSINKYTLQTTEIRVLLFIILPKQNRPMWIQYWHDQGITNIT